MLTTKLFADNRLHRSRLTHFVDRLFRRDSREPTRPLLRKVIRHPVVVVIAALAIFMSSLTLVGQLAVEYMPREDRAFAMVRLTAPEGASLDYTLKYT